MTEPARADEPTRAGLALLRARKRVEAALDDLGIIGPAQPDGPDVAAAAPWQPRREAATGVECPICTWTGSSYDGPVHCEGLACPGCGSIARDRFLHHCARWQRTPVPGDRVLETSPRLSRRYRKAMGQWFRYTASDYDQRAHRGRAKLDLQAIDRPDDSFDVIMTAHVLEHVPDTAQALRELRRVLAPAGCMVLQVPILQGATAPPTEPEFHGDDTPVFWRFGFDLLDALRAAGFDATIACTLEWDRLSRGQAPRPADVSGEFDLDSMLRGARSDDQTTVADDAEAARLGAHPGYQHLTFICG